MTGLRTGTWVVVADSAMAMILQNTGDTRHPVLTPVLRETSEELLAAEDRSRRLADHMQAETVEPPDYGRMAGERLARDLAERLTQAARAGRFDRLVLVASPQVLGALRDELDDTVRALVVAELHKTLTGHPLPEVSRLVAEAVAEGG
ncbi:MAG: host attachment protein [Rhodobacterales bacterium]|nr:host attachment protein [Rhodobacterales bacterium]